MSWDEPQYPLLISVHVLLYPDKRDGMLIRNDSRRGVLYRRRCVGILLKRLGKTWKLYRYNNEDKGNMYIEITQWVGCMSVGFKIAARLAFELC
jgi:hypothetical protein